MSLMVLLGTVPCDCVIISSSQALLCLVDQMSQQLVVQEECPGAHWAVAQRNPENLTLVLKKITHEWGLSRNGEDYVFVGEDEFFVKNRSCEDDVFGEDYGFHELYCFFKRL